jgi:P27 family predicted phage terminase small subunit
MTRGPPPEPTALRILRGNPSRRPLNRNEPHPQSDPECPKPPGFLFGHAADEWRRIGPELHANGLLTRLDTTTFAVYCTAYGRWRTAEEMLEKEDLVTPGSSRNKVTNPILKIAVEAARDVIRYGNEFGLTPSARARVRAGGQPVNSKFGDLLA